MKWFWIVLLLASRAVAAPIETPRFLIERIDVRNLRFARPDIIRAELRVPPGHEYTEQQLREASDRINRLPFVLDSEFSLEKGSTRGSYVLVVTVTETKPVFYSVTGGLTWVEFQTFTEHQESGNATLGGRTFLGGRTEVHAAYSASGNLGVLYPKTIDAGVTQYGLFGSGAFAQLNLTCPVSGPFRNVVPDFLLGIPFRSTQTLTVDYSTTRFVSRNTFPVPTGEPVATEETGTIRQLGAKLAYNTTDDPFFPTRGVILSISPTIRWQQTRISQDVSGQRSSFTNSSRQEDLALQAVRYWQISQSNSISTLGQLNRTKSSGGLLNRRETLDTSTADLGFLHSFRSGRKRAEAGEMGLEFHVARSTFREVNSGVGPPGTFHSSSTFVTADWFHRSAWGTLRFGASYSKSPTLPILDSAAPSPPLLLPPQFGTENGGLPQ